MSERSLKERLARFMDPQAYEPVPKRIGKIMGKALHDSRKARREIAMRRAAAAIRFFSKPAERALLDARIARLSPASDAPPASSHSATGAVEAGASGNRGGVN
jgi:hypothetical protein